MINILGIDHLVLRTSRLTEMVKFYTEVLGCSVVRDEVAQIGLLQLKAGDALIDLVEVESELGRIGGGPPLATNRNLDHFCLRLAYVDNQNIIKHLQSHDVKCEPFDRRNGAQGFGDSIYIYDPDDNRVELKSEIINS
mgnify:CR=1 FL=1